MEKQSNVLDLNENVQTGILSFLSPKDFINLSLTCKYFKFLLEKGSFWKAYVSHSGSKGIISCANIQVNPSLFYDFVKFAFQTFYKEDITNMLPPPDPNRNLLSLTAIEASSTDYNQSIEKTLEDDTHTFWSSMGSGDENSSEYITFLFSKYLVIPSSISVTFFTAADYYLEGTFEFPCKQIEVEFSFDGKNWEFVTEKVNVNGKHEVEINLKGKVGIARYMKVNFIGKTVKQPGDELYYLAIERVKCFGYKIDPNDKVKEPINSLLISSYISWQNQQLHYEVNDNRADMNKEIADYYTSQIFLPDTYVKFLSLLNEKNNKAIWEHIESNKYLRVLETTFIDIFRNYKEFGMYYIAKVLNQKNRVVLDNNETLLMILIFLSHSNLGQGQGQGNGLGQEYNVVEVLRNQYNVQELLRIKYLQLSTNTFQKMREILGVGNQQAIDFMKNSKQSKNF